MISPSDFYNCFRGIVKERELEAIPKSDTEFTCFMLSEKGVLESTLNMLKKKGLVSSDVVSEKEYYSLDMIYRSRDNIHPIFDSGIYPERVDALIEHENRGEPEQEMYKLLLFRCSLKVLINYDWDDDQKSTDKRKIYVLEKRTLFTRLIKGFNNHAIAEKGSSYLFIIGDRASSDAESINWQAWKYDDKGNETELQ